MIQKYQKIILNKKTQLKKKNIVSTVKISIPTRYAS